MSDRQVISKITIERFLTGDGRDLVHFKTEDMGGNELAMVEALGLLQLAIWDVCNRPSTDAEENA